MTAVPEVTVTGVRYWLDRPEQLAQLLKTSRASAISDPTGQSVRPNEFVVLTCREEWADAPRELHDALAQALGSSNAVVSGSPAAAAAGAVAPVEDRLVFTVEEAAQLLGISRSFAYEAVQRGEIPSMRIGKRILVPKAALSRLLAGHDEDQAGLS
jgi:excisionase family DNA binding protein